MESPGGEIQRGQEHLRKAGKRESRYRSGIRKSCTQGEAWIGRSPVSSGVTLCPPQPTGRGDPTTGGYFARTSRRLSCGGRSPDGDCRGRQDPLHVTTRSRSVKAGLPTQPEAQRDAKGKPPESLESWGGWRAVCAERCMHGSGRGRRKRTTRRYHLQGRPFRQVKVWIELNVVSAHHAIVPRWRPTLPEGPIPGFGLVMSRRVKPKLRVCPDTQSCGGVQTQAPGTSVGVSDSYSAYSGLHYPCFQPAAPPAEPALAW